jgi:putative PIN family toxin of toxin-antitoxin system
MISAVFDCMVFVQAITSTAGPSAACLGFVEEGHVRLFLSADVVAEVRHVFLRSSTRMKYPDLTRAKVELVLAKLTALGEVKDTVPLALQLPRDPKDECYLNLAIAAQASFIVTWDDDLLSLMKQTAFRKDHPSLSVVDPVTFLAHVRGRFEKKAG